MTPEQFCYWLQGFAELHEAPPGCEQWQSIREHLATVFNKVTPQMPQPLTIKEQLDKLRKETPAPFNPFNPFDPNPGRWLDPSYKQPDFVC